MKCTENILRFQTARQSPNLGIVIHNCTTSGFTKLEQQYCSYCHTKTPQRMM